MDAMQTRPEAHSNVTLSLLDLPHAETLFQLVDENRDYLRQWLPWVDATESVTDTENFLRAAIEQRHSGKGPQFAVLWQGSLCGVCGFHAFDTRNRIGSIGYWLGERFCGRGIMVLAVQQLLEVGFNECKLNRIEIACATENHRSRAIPERLGFYYEGVIRERERLNGRYVDHAMYSLLADEFFAQDRSR